ncbi:MAG: MBL fold metallo-hydrolase [Candidatus Thorarchaeota archaeon]|jgi:glyoxylase-like metal-dependent hydrolase (beta-lactamase superfamily II)
MTHTIIDFDVEEVSPRTVAASYESYFNLKAGAVALDDFIVVIDTLLYPRQAERFREELEAKFELPVKYLFITHFHGDHHYGASPFKDVEVFGSNALIENMKRQKEEGWTKEAFDGWKKEEPDFAEYIDEIQIVIPTKGFEKERVIKNKDLQVEFYHSGGHSSCSSYAYFPNEEVLFTGDDLAAESWPYISDTAGDPEKWMKTFEHMLSLDIDVVVPGHGPLAGKEQIEEQLSFLQALKNAVLRAISEGKGPEDVEVPEFYGPAEDWQIPRALEHLHGYYSTNTD